MKTFDEMVDQSCPKLLPNGWLSSGSVKQATPHGVIRAEGKNHTYMQSRGKGYTTRWYLDGKRITKDRAKEILG